MRLSGEIQEVTKLYLRSSSQSKHLFVQKNSALRLPTHFGVPQQLNFAQKILSSYNAPEQITKQMIFSHERVNIEEMQIASCKKNPLHHQINKRQYMKNAAHQKTLSADQLSSLIFVNNNFHVCYYLLSQKIIQKEIISISLYQQKKKGQTI